MTHSMSTFRVGLTAIALLGFSYSAGAQTAKAPSAAPAPKHFQQDRFAIGFWVDPPADSQMGARYQEIADANFTLVLGGFGANWPETIERQIPICGKFGLKVLTCSPNPEYQPEGDACWGYCLRDEPSASMFAELAKRVDAIRTAHPGKLAYINLLPNYASPEQLGTETFDEYVSRFVSEVKPDVLSVDHYPLFKPGVADGRDNYCADLEVMRKYSLEAGIPFWNFFNCMPYGQHTDPTEAQLRWQVYTSLAYGAKGVLYFCYFTPLSPEFPKGGAIIGRDGKPTRHYDEAKRINAELKNLGPTLMKLTSTGVHRITPDGDTAKELEVSPIKRLARADYDPKHDLLIGVFKHADGRRAVLINNYHFAYTAWPTVEFDTDLSKIVEVDNATGKEVPVHDDSPEIEGLQVSLGAGEGRLFLISDK